MSLYVVHSSMVSRVEKTPLTEQGRAWPRLVFSLEGPKFISVQRCVSAFQLMQAEGCVGRDCNSEGVRVNINNYYLRNQPPLEIESTKMSWGPGILEQSMGDRNRQGRGFSYRPARLFRLAESIPLNRFLGSLKVLKYRLSYCSVRK